MGVPSRIVRVVVAALAWALAATVAAAASTLVGARPESVPGQGPGVALVFSGGVPTYQISGNGTTDISVVLTGTTVAGSVPTQLGGTDPLAQITIAAAGTATSVAFHLAVPARLVFAPGPGQTLVGVFTALAPQVRFFGPGGSTAPAVVAASSSGSQLEVVPLKYADVSEVVGLLVPGQQIPSNDVFVPQQQNFGSPGSGSGYGTLGGLSQPVQQQQTAYFANGGAATSLGQQINENIGIDRRLNAVVLSGPADVVARLKESIAKIDVPLPTVAFETQIVELTDSAAHDVGIDYTAAGGPTASAQYDTHSLLTGTGNVNLQAAVYAQVTRGRGKVIARPRIVAQSGGSAQILTGDALPIVTSIAVSGVNAVSQQVQYVNVGVSLQIQPRISRDGFVTSHIYSQVSSVTGYQQGYPTLSQREATTSATVRDGEAFVIGGLLQNNELDNLSKVPGLGDLPILGALFRVRHQTMQSTNLYIIVVPRILTDGSPAPGGLPLR